jgi:hypothetical protein
METEQQCNLGDLFSENEKVVIPRENITKAGQLLAEATNLLGGIPFAQYDPEDTPDLYRTMDQIYRMGKGIFIVFYNNDLRMKMWLDSLPEGMPKNEEMKAYVDDGEGVTLG